MSDTHQTLHYEAHGSGQPVVLLHPVAMRGEFWRPVIGALSHSCRVVAVDLRGHGRNPRAPEPFTLDEMADDVIAVMRRERLDDAVVVGCSIGGMVAQGIAVRAGEMLAGLALTNTNHAMSEKGAAIMRQRAEATLSGLDTTVETDLHRWFSPAFAMGNPDTVARFRQWVLENDPETIANAWKAIAGLSYGRALKRFGKPVLVMTGSEDPASPPEVARATSAALPNAHYVEIAEAGHFTPVERPIAFAAAIEGFLAELAPTRSKRRDAR